MLAPVAVPPCLPSRIPASIASILRKMFVELKAVTCSRVEFADTSGRSLNPEALDPL